MTKETTNIHATEWAHVGTDILEKEKIGKIRNGNFNKPVGGLWLSRKTGNKCSWLEVLTYRPYLNCKSTDNSKGCVVNLREDANICIIDSKERLVEVWTDYKLENAQNDYKYNLDYTKLQKDYDGIYIDNSIDPSFKHFDIVSLNIFNPEIIESYQPFSVTVREITDYCSFSELVREIGKYGEVVPMNDSNDLGKKKGQLTIKPNVCKNSIIN